MFRAQTGVPSDVGQQEPREGLLTWHVDEAGADSVFTCLSEEVSRNMWLGIKHGIRDRSLPHPNKDLLLLYSWSSLHINNLYLGKSDLSVLLSIYLIIYNIHLVL